MTCDIRERVNLMSVSVIALFPFFFPLGCSDNDVKCEEWARTGECKKNPEWMNQNCMKSCGQC